MEKSGREAIAIYFSTEVSVANSYIIDANWQGICIDNSNRVSCSNNMIRNSKSGYVLTSSIHCSITGVTIFNSGGDGILITTTYEVIPTTSSQCYHGNYDSGIRAFERPSMGNQRDYFEVWIFKHCFRRYSFEKQRAWIACLE